MVKEPGGRSAQSTVSGEEDGGRHMTGVLSLLKERHKSVDGNQLPCARGWEMGLKDAASLCTNEAKPQSRPFLLRALLHSIMLPPNSRPRQKVWNLNCHCLKLCPQCLLPFQT